MPINFNTILLIPSRSLPGLQLSTHPLLELVCILFATALGSQPLDTSQFQQRLIQADLALEQAAYFTAYQQAEEALQIIQEQLGPDHPLIAEVLIRHGNYFLEVANFEQALSAFERANQYALRDPENYRQLLAQTYHSLGNFHSRLGDMEKAISFYKKALNIRRNELGESHLQVADSYNNLGNQWARIGDHYQALNFHRQALIIRHENLGNSGLEIAQSYHNLGNDFYQLGMQDEAVESFEISLSIREDLLGPKHPLLGQSYNSLGNLFQSTGHLESATTAYKNALRIRRANLGDKHPETAQSYNNLGNLYLEQGQLSQALMQYQSALKLDTILQEMNHPVYVQTLINLGGCYQKMGRYDMAEAIYREVRAKLAFEPKASQPFHKVQQAWELLTVLYASAQLHQQQSGELQWGKALDYYRYAIQLIDHLRSSYLEENAKFELGALARDIYEQAISLCFQNRQEHPHLLEEAFAYSEKSKGLVLLESLRGASALDFAQLPDSLIKQEEGFKRKINALEKVRLKAQLTLEEKGGKVAKIKALDRQIFELKWQFQTFRDKLQQQYPNYHRLKYDYHTLPIEQIFASILEENQTMIEYFWGKENGYIFLLDKKNGLQVFCQPKDQLIEDKIKAFLMKIYTYNYQPGTQLLPEYTALANELSQHLLAPLIEGSEWPERLLIVPDGLLNYLPFSALLTPDTGKSTYFADPPFLIKKSAVSYTYSVSLLSEMKNKQSQSRGALLVAPGYQTDSRGFSSLQNEKEVRAIHALTRSDTLIGQQANLPNLLQRYPPERYQILHFALHALANDVNGVLSFLAFSEVLDSMDNEALYVKDLYGMKLGAEMVVLSGCQTAVGEWQQGEGVISLARGFAYAGAKSIITTLWNLNDQSGVELMTAYYTALKAGLAKDEALQQAQLQYLKTNPGDAHPFYWAAFVPVGDMGAIRFSDPPFAWKKATLLLIGLLVVVLVFVKLLGQIKRERKVAA